MKLFERLHWGLVITARDRAGVLAQARRAEAAGFDSIWVVDHVAFYTPILESLTLLSFAAGVTERIRLCTGVYLMPLRHPTTTAKVASSLDVLSNGRLTLGVGVGGEFPPEFTAAGIPVEERGARTDEGIRILRRLWTEEKVVHEGRHFRFGPVSLEPRPVQAAGPRIVIGGRKGPTFRRAGELGDGYISHMCSPARYAANLDDIERHAARFGRELGSFESAAFLFTVLDDDAGRALDRASDLLGTFYNRPFRQAASRYGLLGTPADCRARIEDFARAGARHFVFSVLGEPEEFTAFVERFEREIRPGLESIELGAR